MEFKRMWFFLDIGTERNKKWKLPFFSWCLLDMEINYMDRNVYEWVSSLVRYPFLTLSKIYFLLQVFLFDSILF